MKMRKYINSHSQSGAALLLVLFAVLFLSITGAMLLNTTTYSLRSNETNEVIQEEFYAAEGALDIVLDDISKQPSLYNELKTMDYTSEREMFETSPGYYKEIGDEPISVKLRKMSEDTDSVTVELTASKVSENRKDRVVRVVIHNENVSSHTILFSSGEDPLNYPSKNEKKTHALLLGADEEDVGYYANVYKSFDDYYIKGIEKDFTELEQMELVIGNDSTKGSVYFYDDSLELKTGENLTVKANNIVFITGTLYQKGQSIINIEEGAILLANNLMIGNGNKAQNIINGALVVNSFSAASNGQGINMNVVIGENAGIKCDIINSISPTSGVAGCGATTPGIKLQIEDYKTQ